MESFEVNKMKEQQKQHALKQMAQQTGHSVAHLAAAQHTSHNPGIFGIFDDGPNEHDAWGSPENSSDEGPNVGPALIPDEAPAMVVPEAPAIPHPQQQCKDS